jgi:hypothetical protein
MSFERLPRPLRSGRLVIAWALALFSAGCQSDATTICSKLASCQLLPSGNGFDESECEAQVTGELGEHDRADCADCVDAHACSQIIATCRPECAPKVTCIDADRCPDGGAE